MSTIIDKVHGEVRPEGARERTDAPAPAPRRSEAEERLRLLLRRLEQRRVRLEAD
jgi:hypothetical protein